MVSYILANSFCCIPWHNHTAISITYPLCSNLGYYQHFLTLKWCDTYLAHSPSHIDKHVSVGLISERGIVASISMCVLTSNRVKMPPEGAVRMYTLSQWSVSVSPQ